MKYEIIFKNQEGIKLTFKYESHARFFEQLRILNGSEEIEVLQVLMNGKDITFLV